MALNATLGRKQAKAATTTVVATVTADKGDAGIRIVTSKLTVTARGIERVGVEAGAAAHASPAAARIATIVLSKGAHSTRFPGTFRVARSRDSVRRLPSAGPIDAPRA